VNQSFQSDINNEEEIHIHEEVLSLTGDQLGRSASVRNVSSRFNFQNAKDAESGRNSAIINSNMFVPICDRMSDKIFE
jgi:hypothetical protein